MLASDAQLPDLGGPAPEADVAVGADGHQAASGAAGKPVEGDMAAERQLLDLDRVAVQEHVYPRAGEQLMQPGLAAAAGYGRIRQPLPGPGAACEARGPFHHSGLWA